ncbi:Crp/Fnr family transcriptional regulator [Micromonospora sp. NPDC048999]|uniref:Crp/Fnr family transcriptional regulator n=1 Tax=Micromonospora sp. NPDC048999 TaxID=3155391 RepID=UPI0034005A18
MLRRTAPTPPGPVRSCRVGGRRAIAGTPRLSQTCRVIRSFPNHGEVGVDGAARRPKVSPPKAFLARLPTAIRQELLGRGQPCRYEPGDRLLVEGGVDTHVILLTSGFVKVTNVVEGFEALVAIRGAGDIVGESAALADQPRMASVTACGVVTGCLVIAEAFRHVLGRHPDAARLVTATVAERLRWANQRRADFVAYSAEVRLARVLVEIARTYGRQLDDGAVVIDVPLSQPELATMIGVAEATVHKALRTLRDGELIRSGYRRVYILDLDALRRMGHEPPGLSP